jgi:hypothetical protein
MRKIQFRTVHKNHLVVHMKTCLESFPPPPSSKKSLILGTFLMYFEFLDKKELMLCKTNSLNAHAECFSLNTLRFNSLLSSCLLESYNITDDSCINIYKGHYT